MKIKRPKLQPLDIHAVETVTIKEALGYSPDALIGMQERGEVEMLATIYKTLLPSPQKRAVRTTSLVKDMLKAMGYSVPAAKAPGRVASPKVEAVEDEMTEAEKVDAVKEVRRKKTPAVKAKTRSVPREKKRVKPQEKELFPRTLQVGDASLIRVDCTTLNEFGHLIFRTHAYGTFVVMQEEGREDLSHFLALYTGHVNTVLADFPTDQGTVLNVMTERLDFKEGQMITVEAGSDPIVEPFAVYVLKEEGGE